MRVLASSFAKFFLGGTFLRRRSKPAELMSSLSLVPLLGDFVLCLGIWLHACDPKFPSSVLHAVNGSNPMVLPLHSFLVCLDNVKLTEGITNDVIKIPSVS